ncbi:MAG: VWA domain-containing protein [Bdellovibrio sp.]|nr:VWA domain-containing protein [Bdellovibrio sp.]
MSRKREIATISLSMLDLLSGALGAMMILYIAVPKAQQNFQQNNLAATNMSSVESSKGEVIPANLGFKFKGKKVVFILDTSGSMEKEERIGQVKAGLKFFLTSLSDEYQIDLIHYPGSMVETYNPLFGELKKFTPQIKTQIFKMLYQIEPRGPTPTREALTFALTHYPELTDIVLLTDGAPTVGMTYAADDIGGILKMVQLLNHGIQISGLGIGRKFLDEPNDPKFQFLFNLAQQNGGFFYGL